MTPIGRYSLLTGKDGRDGRDGTPGPKVGYVTFWIVISGSVLFSKG